MSPSMRCKSAILGTLLVCLIAFSFLPNVLSAVTYSLNENWNTDGTNLGTDWTETASGSDYNMISGGVLILAFSGTGYPSQSIYYKYPSFFAHMILNASWYTDQRTISYVGLVKGGEQSATLGDNTHYIAFKKAYNTVSQITLEYRNGGSASTLATKSVTTSSQMIVVIEKDDNRYLAYVNGELIYNNTLTIDWGATGITVGMGEYWDNGDGHVYTSWIYFGDERIWVVQSSITVGGAPDVLTTLNFNMIAGAITYVLDTIRTVINYIETEVTELAHATVLAYLGTLYEYILQVTSFIQVGMGNVLAHTITYFKSGIATILDFITTHIPIAKTILDSVTVIFDATVQYLTHVATIIKSVLDTYEDEPLGFVVSIIPVLLILLVPTLIMRHYVGEIAVMPMFAFMSIVCYIGQLIPLWITVIVIIGTVVIMFRGRLSRGAT